MGIGDNEPHIIRFGPEDESDRRNELSGLVRNSPIPDSELMMNIGLFLTPQNLSRILFMDHLYRMILEVQGVILEFGCRWGQNLNLFNSLRGIYEPFNRLRRVVGFDSFTGLSSVSDVDGEMLDEGDYATTENYADYLGRLLRILEKESPLPHLEKHQIVKGDIQDTLPEYLENNSHTVVALAYFDLDIYEPTKKSLELILPYLTKGTVLGFDEANDASTPGETIALREILGLSKVSLKRYQWNARTSYLVVQ